MKTSILFIAVSLALSVTAAATQQQQQQNNRNVQKNRGGSRFQPNKGAGGNNGQQKNNNQNSSNNGKNTNQGAAGAAGAGSANTGKVLANGGNNNATASANSGANNGAAAGAADDSDPQSSLTLDPKVIATGFADDGQDVPTAGQVASLTSKNNFINFCLTVPNLPITNGKQITTGSCNPAPMGVIPSSDNMPSAKFVFPKNGDTSIKANTAFTIQMAVANFQTGAFVNAQENYFAAPQTVNAQGQIIGHSHVVVESLTALDQTTPTDPKKFAFFKGLNDAAVNGILTADVADGLPAGVYKLSSINTAANHQPVLVPIAQHGSLDDAVYFTITDDGQAAAGSGADATATDVAGAAATSGTAANANGAATGANGAAASGTGAAASGANGSAANANGGAAATANNGAANKGGAGKGQQQKGQQQQGKGRQQQQQQKQQKGGRRRRYAREFF